MRAQSIVAAMFVKLRLGHDFVLENKKICLRRGACCVAVVKKGEDCSVFFSFFRSYYRLTLLYKMVSSISRF